MYLCTFVLGSVIILRYNYKSNLIHIPTTDSDCFGNNSTVNQGVNGSVDNWNNLATLLKAGINGVKQVDDNIDIMLHVENT